MKNSKKIILATTVVFSTLFSLCACNGSSNAALNATEVYGMGAVSAVKLLGSEVAGNALAGLSSVASLAAREGSNQFYGNNVEAVKTQAENLHPYLTMLDSFFADDVLSTTVSSHTDEGYVDYEYKLSILGRDIYGNAVTHLMYYNETQLPANPDDDDEGEVEYRLTGVLVMDGVNFPMEGERSFESERDEQESEIAIRAYLSETDRTTYVQVRQELETEAGEQEENYVYSLYEGGRLVEETSVEFEVEADARYEEKAKYEVEFLSGAGRGEYRVKRVVENNQPYLYVDYYLNGERGAFGVYESVSGEVKTYSYVFADGSTLVFTE